MIKDIFVIFISIMFVLFTYIFIYHMGKDRGIQQTEAFYVDKSLRTLEKHYKKVQFYIAAYYDLARYFNTLCFENNQQQMAQKIINYITNAPSYKEEE